MHYLIAKSPRQLNATGQKALPVTNCLSEVAASKLAETLKNQKFTVLADKSTDMASNRVLMIAVCFFDSEQGKICYAPFEIVDMAHDQGNAEGVFTLMKNAFEDRNIPLQNIVGYASDGEAVMCGNNCSVLTYLKSEVPDLFFFQVPRSFYCFGCFKSVRKASS